MTIDSGNGVSGNTTSGLTPAAHRVVLAGNVISVEAGCLGILNPVAMARMHRVPFTPVSTAVHPTEAMWGF